LPTSCPLESIEETRVKAACSLNI